MADPPAIRLADVRYRYRAGRAWALDGLDLSIEPGDALAVAGSNGSGKTTLAHLIAGLLEPSHGTVMLGGRPTGEFPAGLIARSIGLVFQNPDDQIFSPTVAAEVAYGPEQIGMPPDRISAQVTGALDRFDLAALRDVPAAALPFNYRRRVCLAAVWAMDTPVLILDEPSWGLDVWESRQLIRGLTEARAAGKTVVVISHDVRLLMNTCSRMLIMDRGRVISDGPMRDLLSVPDGIVAQRVSIPDAIELATRLGLLEQIAGDPTVEALCSALSRQIRQRGFP